MPRVVYIGRESKHVGKTAFKILANLKNFGIGRMLTRHEFDAFPEPSYHIVKRVEPWMDPEWSFGTIWCETVIRGKRLPGIRPLDVTYRPDFRLISKEDEEHYLKSYPIKNLGEEMNVLPKSYSVPPLMKEYMVRRFKKVQEISGQVSEFYDPKSEQVRIPFVYQTVKEARKKDADLFWIENRVAKDDNEKTTVEFDGNFHFNDEYRQSAEAHVPNTAEL